LRELGINEEIIPTMAEEALDAVDRPTNPRHNNVKDLEAIYRSAY
jgi:alcohol dehydrogenase class IV